MFIPDIGSQDIIKQGFVKVHSKRPMRIIRRKFKPQNQISRTIIQNFYFQNLCFQNSTNLRKYLHATNDAIVKANYKLNTCSKLILYRSGEEAAQSKSQDQQSYVISLPILSNENIRAYYQTRISLLKKFERLLRLSKVTISCMFYPKSQLQLLT